MQEEGGGSLWAFLKFTISHLSLFGTAFCVSPISALMGVPFIPLNSNLFIYLLPGTLPDVSIKEELRAKGEQL